MMILNKLCYLFNNIMIKLNNKMKNYQYHRYSFYLTEIKQSHVHNKLNNLNLNIIHRKLYKNK